MKFCPPHWEKLRAAIELRGLTPFCATTDSELQRRMGAGPEVAPTSAFEPLMGAHNAILTNTLRIGGMELFGPTANGENGGEWCPICFLKTCPCGDPECPPKFEAWIDRAADDMLATAQELRLVGTA